MGSKSTTFPYSPPSSSKRPARPYVKLLLLAFAAAVFCVLVFHSVKEKRLLGILMQQNEHELHSLHSLLQKEKEISEEMKKKIEEMKEEAVSLRSQNSGLIQKLAETRNIASYLKERQTELESAQEESQRKIKILKGLESDFAKARNQIKLLNSELERQGDKVEAMKHHIELLSSKQDNATVAGSEIHVNETLRSAVVDGESRESELPAREKNLEAEKAMLNEPVANSDENNEVISGTREVVKLAANTSESGIGSEESAVKEGALEGDQQTGNRTDMEDKVLATESLVLVNKTNGQEYENSTHVEPDILMDSNHGEKLEVTDAHGMDQANDSKITRDHSNPIKQRRRRHRALTRSRRALSIARGQFEKGRGDDQHSIDQDRKNRERSGYREMVNILDTKNNSAPAMLESASYKSEGHESVEVPIQITTSQ